MTQSYTHHPDQQAASAPDAPKPKKHPILIIVMGVAGTGKTTLARALEARLDMPYVEGDALHPAANIAKMSAGIPLTDADREPWLELIRTTAEHMAASQQADPSFARRPGVLVTCSALRGYYRDILRGTRAPPGLQLPEHLEPPAPYRLPAYFVYIKGSREVIMDRISKREGHYMKPGMLDSQLQTLESPEGEDGVVVVPLEASTEEQADIAIRELSKLLPEPL
ncbi:carbohydrate kinase [Lentinus tigrinus ALCF2SS1-7]|uniref:carbohydrate kinase n=1 Tax=Lentinus tigrinus ALCF2SS1-7 TaxID=1328758 RepID=UPI001165D215|nr:carbohydrate kinase [Lentinus tigrinus ALCF2SS1-7]